MAAEGDQVRDLFGSESEDDADALGPLPADGAGMEDGGEPGPSEAPQDQMRDLFGSDEEEENASPAAVGVTWDDGEEGQGAEATERGPAMVVEVPLHRVPPPDALHLVKMSNILGLEAAPFDAETFAAAQEDATVRDRLRDLTTIRWRWGSNDQGQPMQQSNARLVRWSDGSQQLLLGGEVLDVRAIDITGDQNYLFARHAQLIQGQGQLHSKLVFQPASLASGFHRRLAASVEGTGARQGRVRGTTTLADPARAKRERELAEEGRIRDREKLAERQARSMRRYAAPSLPSRPPRLSSAYLEEEEDEALFGDEDGAGAARAPRRVVSDIADARAARRLAAVKRGGAPEPKRGGAPEPKRARTIASEDEDEDLSEEDNLDDFLAPDDEGEAPTAAAPSPPRASQQQQRPKKRTVLLDSDEDD